MWNILIHFILIKLNKTKKRYFSIALVYLGVVWEEGTQNPKRYIPGTMMMFAGIRRNQERVDLITNLKKFTPSIQNMFSVTHFANIGYNINILLITNNYHKLTDSN